MLLFARDVDGVLVTRVKCTFMLNDMIILQLLAFLTLNFFSSLHNIMTLWYLAGLYLIWLGLWFFLDDGDILVGFLWVIDLGVGLIFFIFILHYSAFLHQKSNVDKAARELSFIAMAIFFLGLFFYFFGRPVDSSILDTFANTWVFMLHWYDYYTIFYSQTITELNLLRTIYFANNSFEFILVSFMLFYGIVAAILATFLIKRIFSFLNYGQIVDYKFLNYSLAAAFIKNQDPLQQQGTSTGTRVWLKSKQTRL